MNAVLAVAAATNNDIPKFYEAGWDWWAWPIAWLVFLGCGLALGTVLPLYAAVTEELTGARRGWAQFGVVIGGIAAIVFGWWGSGILMRHQETGEGAAWTFLGALAVAGVSWYWSSRFRQGYGDYDWHTGYALVTAAPALIITAGAVMNGVGEFVTRLAASIPMPVAQFLSLAVLGALVLGLTASTQRR